MKKNNNSPLKMVFHRFLKDKAAVVAGIVFLSIVFIGIFANFLTPYDPNAADVTIRLQSPSMEHILGTDNMGRDIFSRLIIGAQTTVISAIVVICGIILVGVPLGLIAGYYGGFIDNLIMRLADIVSTFPSSLLALAVVAILGPGLMNVMIVLVALWWAPFARILRSEVLKIKGKTYILAAEASGSSRCKIITKHVLKNSLSPMIVYLTLRFAAVIMHIAGFSFIGLGTQPPQADWGVMLSDARKYIATAPMLLVWPGIAIMITIFSLNLFGEGLDNALKSTSGSGKVSKRKLDFFIKSMKNMVVPTDQSDEDEDDDYVLEVKNLSTYYFVDPDNPVKSVNNVSMNIRRGKITAIIGESGSGKSTIAMSVLNLIDNPGKVVNGEILLDGVDLLKLSEKEQKNIYGKEISAVFQEPVSALNPVVKVKKQMMECITLHNKIPHEEAYERCIDALKKVRMRNPKEVMEKYPFELSGGMCQRIMIAMAIVSDSKILIADEPTSGLDLTVQAVILEELKKIRDSGVSILLITHDLGIVAQMADYVYVMSNGEVEESGNVYDIFNAPEGDYTKELINATHEKLEAV